MNKEFNDKNKILNNENKKYTEEKNKLKKLNNELNEKLKKMQYKNENLKEEYKKYIKDNINQNNKLNQKILELEEVKNQYQTLQKDFDKLNIENSKHMEEKNKFEQLYNEFINKYKEEKNQHNILKKAYENQKKQIVDSNKIMKDLEKKFNNNNAIYEELIKEKEKNKILEDKIKENENKFNEYIISKVNNNNSINNTNKDKLIKKVYSYDCLNKNKLSYYIYEGTVEAKIEIILKNNGEEDWPKDCTKLIFDKASKITGDEIVLKPQKSGEQNNYNVIFKKVSKYRVGEYKSYLLFYVNDETFGEILELTIRIIENKKNPEIDENIDKINEFRQNYDLDKNDYSNSKILGVLKKNNFDYDEAFVSLFIDNNL